MGELNLFIFPVCCSASVLRTDDFSGAGFVGFLQSESEMASSVERDVEVVSLELPAPQGWTKKVPLFFLRAFISC